VGHRLRQQLSALLLASVLLLGSMGLAPAAWATGVADFTDQAPATHVIDTADLISRAANTELD
jgi:uncharacterized protein